MANIYIYIKIYQLMELHHVFITYYLCSILECSCLSYWMLLGVSSALTLGVQPAVSRCFHSPCVLCCLSFSSPLFGDEAAPLLNSSRSGHGTRLPILLSVWNHWLSSWGFTDSLIKNKIKGLYFFQFLSLSFLEKNLLRCCFVIFLMCWEF